MNISECLDFLNFWVNKKNNAWLTVNEAIEVIDRGQIAYYTDLQSRYATSQRIKDALAPFRDSYDFTNADSLLGVITVPSARNYMDLLDISINYAVSGRGITAYVPIALINEDERAERLNSQLDPVTATNPIGEQTGQGVFQLWPKIQYTGTVNFLRRPVKPVFGYTTISGRVLVYDSATSTQLEWNEQHIVPVLLKALASIGVNLSDEEASNFAQIKSQENWQNVNRL
jgi:hypothetical protein